MLRFVFATRIILSFSLSFFRFLLISYFIVIIMPTFDGTMCVCAHIVLCINIKIYYLLLNYYYYLLFFLFYI